MANMTLSRMGAVNDDATDTKAAQEALFLKVFTGEVLTNFEQQTCMLDKHTVRTISSGKSASFALTGTTAAAYHVPGSELVGTQVKHNEKVITIDGLLLSQISIASIDEAMNHYDVRGIYSKEMAIALANAFDKNVLQEGVLGARASNLITGLNGGTVITSAATKLTAGAGNAVGTAGTATTLALQAAALRDAIFKAATQLDIKNAPKVRYCVLRPAEFYALFQDTTLINSLYGNGGNLATGTLPQIAGINIMVSNNLPGTDLSANTFHGVNAEFTSALIFCPEAIGTVKLMDLAVESEWQMRYQSTLMAAKYAMGNSWLRPEALVEIKAAAA